MIRSNAPRRISAGLALFLFGLLVGTVGPDVLPSAYAKGTVARAIVRNGADYCTQTHPKKVARVTALLRGKNAYVARLELDPGGKVSEHRDATEEYIVIQSGRGKITIDDVTHSVKPGSAIYMPANAKVRFEGGPESLVALQVFAGPEPAKKYDSWLGCR